MAAAPPPQNSNPLHSPDMDASTSDASAIMRHDVHARFYLGVIVIVQFVALVAYLTYKGTQLADSQLILGAEIGFVATVLNFFFGSSSGSVSKSASKTADGAQSTTTVSSP